MALTSIEHYTLDPESINIPDEGLGEFLYGFTEEKIRFNWANLLWNLLPFAGQAFFLGFVIKHWLIKFHAKRILLYKNGFIKQKLRSKGTIKEESSYDFNDIKGILYAKTRHYQNIYGFTLYKSTVVKLLVLDSNNIEEVVLEGEYRNKKEVDGKYNFIGYTCNAISNVWMEHAIERFNNEITSKGYGTFTCPTGEILVGRDFIKVNDEIISSGFKYSFNEGYLYLFPNAAEGGHFKQKGQHITINVAGMYNKEVFLMALSQFFGIR